MGREAMNRRKFLQAMGLIPIAAAIPAILSKDRTQLIEIQKGKDIWLNGNDIPSGVYNITWDGDGRIFVEVANEYWHHQFTTASAQPPKPQPCLPWYRRYS